MYLKYRNSSGVQTPVLNIAQIPTLTLAKIPTIPYSKQGVATLWSGSHLLSNGNVYALRGRHDVGAGRSRYVPRGRCGLGHLQGREHRRRGGP